MAAAAKSRKDLGGVTTGGSSTAYTITSNQVFDSLANMSGNVITIIPHTTSGAAPTLNVDSLGAKALNVSTGVAIPTGAMIAGSPFTFVYVNASSEFILINAIAVLNTISGNTVSGNMVATQANQETGTATDLIVPPGRQHFNAKHPKAWANVNGTGTPAVTVGSGVASISDNGTGDYSLNWTVAFSTANYGTTSGGSTSSGGSAQSVVFDRSTSSGLFSIASASSQRVNTYILPGFSAGDFERSYVAAFGDFA